jgi:hypothetical protein
MRVFEVPIETPPTRVIADGFGDRIWFDALHEAFTPAARQFPIGILGMNASHELVEGRVKILRRPFPFLCSPVTSHTPRYGWNLSDLPDPKDVSKILRELLMTSPCRGIEFRLLAEGGGTLRLLRAISETNDWIMSIEEEEQTPLVDVTGEWEAYRRCKSANLMKTLNWKENKLRRLGSFSFREVGQQPGWLDWLEKALELESAGWKGREGSAILQRPNEARFYRKISEAAAAERRLRLFLLTLGERLIAFQLLVAEHDVLYLLKLAYDEPLAAYSPGNVLQRLVLRDCFADPNIHTVDLAGPGDWKLRWATRTERLMRVRMAPSCSLIGFLLRAEMIAKRLRALLLHHALTRVTQKVSD